MERFRCIFPFALLRYIPGQVTTDKDTPLGKKSFEVICNLLQSLLLYRSIGDICQRKDFSKMAQEHIYKLSLKMERIGLPPEGSLK
jgi:hypothetical protein